MKLKRIGSQSWSTLGESVQEDAEMGLAGRRLGLALLPAPPFSKLYSRHFLNLQALPPLAQSSPPCLLNGSMNNPN